jgi:Putative secretion activating protein
VDIASLTQMEAKRIYRRDYWEFVSGDALPWPLSYFVFDAAVNQGVAPAIRMLQQALGVEADGIIGPQTLAAVGRFPQSEVCSLFLALRGFGMPEHTGSNITG